MSRVFAAFVSAALLATAPAGVARAEVDPAEVAQARVIYQQLLNGQLQISELSPQQLAELVEIDKQLRADKRSVSQRCVDEETERAGGRPSYLARRVIDMKCREPR